jgi:hypothetical protein
VVSNTHTVAYMASNYEHVSILITTTHVVANNY